MNQRVLPIVLIAVGVIWLLLLTGFVPPSLTAAVARLWPLLLIAGGLDLWIPERRPRDVPFVAVGAGIILLFGLFWPAAPAGLTGAPAGRDVHHGLLPQTRQVALDIDAGSPETIVTAAADAATLIGARFTGDTPARVNVSGGDTARVRVQPQRGGFTLFSARSRWQIEVPRGLPLELAFDGGSGPSRLDLASTQLTALDLEVGSGPATVELPGGGRPYAVSVEGGSGSLDLSIAPGASVDMRADLRSGPTRMFIGEGTDIRLVLDLGSGPLELDLPDSAPIRLTVEDDGSGPLRLPSFLERRSGRGDTGVWESASLRDGGRVIDVVLENVGSGPVTIR